MKIALVIPALDEELAIGALLAKVDRALVSEIVVGDNGSLDSTPEIARSHGARVVNVADRGYGAACAGALQAISEDIEIVIFMDADGSDDPSEMQWLVDPIRSGQYDFVVGSRAFVAGHSDSDVPHRESRMLEPGALTPQQRIGNWLAIRLIALFFGHRYSDLGPFRAIRRDLLDSLAMEDRRYGWTVEMQIRAVQLNARITEVPVSCLRRAGRSKISGTISGVIKAAWWIFYTIGKCAWKKAKGRRQKAEV